MSRPPGPLGVRVAHVATSDMPLRYLLLHQMQALRDAGFDVAGISAVDGEGARIVEAGGIRHIPVPMSRRMTPLGDLRALFSLFRVLRRERFDIVHTHTPKAGLLGQYAALFAGVPLRVHTIHGLYFPGHMHPRARFAYVLLERVTMLFSHHNFSQSPEDLPVIAAEKIADPARVELIGNGIDLSAFAPELQAPQKRRATRAALGLADTDLVVGVVARLVWEKGYAEMFEAVRILKKAEPRARFIFVGPLEPAKPDAIPASALAAHGIDDVAQLLGFRHDVADLCAIMDVHVLPSHREGFPRSPMEAAAMGVPSVVTDIRGCRQTVDHGVTGLLVPARDGDALARAILQLLQSPETRRRMGEAARLKALREFDERVVFAKIGAAYHRLLR
jgi:glycosyltransferase involved in cell wall biosynthesis